MRRREKPSSFRSGPRRTARNPSGNACGQRIEAIVDSSGGGRLMPASMANEKGWRRRPKDTEYTLDFAATLGGKLVAGKKLYHPVKCAADAKLGALARGMAQGHNSMETMTTPRQDMLVGALEGFLEDLPSS